LVVVVKDQERIRRLEALYRRIPAIDCRGLCQECCGPIEMTPTERARIARRGVDIPLPMAAAVAAQLTCPALTAEGRCSVYNIRPLICRLWGVAESMPCPYGCEPERWLGDREAYSLMMDGMEAGGWSQPADVDEMRRLLMNPDVLAQVSAIGRWGTPRKETDG
jgi:hypothetical protein